MTKSAQNMVATLVRAIFAQPNQAEMLAQDQRELEQLARRFAKAAMMAAEAADEVLALASFPKQHRQTAGPLSPAV